MRMWMKGGNHARALSHPGSVASSSSMISALECRKRRPSSCVTLLKELVMDAIMMFCGGGGGERGNREVGAGGVC